MISRRQFTRGCAGLLAAAVCHPRHLSARENFADEIDHSLASAMRFLADRQAADGGWRSTIYGPLKDGCSLTALIGSALVACQPDESAEPLLHRASEYLTDAVTSNMTYPVYSAAGATIVLQSMAGQRASAAAAAWREYLRRLQHTEVAGWSPADDGYGGWSYSHEAPRPIDGKSPSPLAVANLSATAFALEALAAGDCKAADPAHEKALVFLERCQNFSGEPRISDREFNDGGFFFLLEEPQSPRCARHLCG